MRFLNVKCPQGFVVLGGTEGKCARTHTDTHTSLAAQLESCWTMYHKPSFLLDCLNSLTFLLHIFFTHFLQRSLRSSLWTI